jgi:hypothetical protein
VTFYPNSALNHAKLALAYRAAKNSRGANREAARALQLHEITPHKDKKLPADLMRKLTAKDQS